LATIKDIAQIVGVSCTTVSNVINGKSGRVSAETIARINDTIKELGYVPNMSARSLVSNNSKVIGIINHLIVNKQENFMEDPFHSAFIGAIEATLRENGYYLMLRTVETADDLQTFLRNWNVDGLFFTGIFKDSFYEELTKLSIPIVLIDSYVSHRNMCNVGLEDYKGGYLATKHLLEHGHRNIAFVSPLIKENGVLYQRLLGYKQALQEFHIPIRDEMILQAGMDVASCLHTGAKIAARNDITALFATADIMAAGIIAGLRQAGKRVPEDISIIGFDDLSISRITDPPLTTIHQDANEKGRQAAYFMLDRLENRTLKQREIILPVHLVERNSVLTI